MSQLSFSILEMTKQSYIYGNKEFLVYRSIKMNSHHMNKH